MSVLDQLGFRASLQVVTGWNANDRRLYDFDAQAKEALALQLSAPNTAGALWTRIDHEIVGQAPWVPVYNPRSLVMLSGRVGNYQFDPYWSVLIDQLWVR